MPGSPLSRRAKTSATSAAPTTSLTRAPASTAPERRLHDGADEPRLIPPPAEPDGNARDLARDDADAVVMELLTEAEVRRPALIEPRSRDEAFDDDGAHGFVQRAVGAGELDRAVGSPAGELADVGAGTSLAQRVDRLDGAEGSGPLESPGHRVHGVDAPS